MKLNQLLNDFKVVASGFPAFAGLGEHSKGENKVVLSTLSPNALLEQGIEKYYAPVIPRNSKFETTQDILDADLSVKQYIVYPVDEHATACMDKIIVSRHRGTVDYIKDSMGIDWLPVFDSVTNDDIKDKHVIGTLPPHLVAECGAYSAISIKDFDYSKDSDLYGAELSQRILWHSPIAIKQISKDYVFTHIASGAEVIVEFTDGDKVQSVQIQGNDDLGRLVIYHGTTLKSVILRGNKRDKLKLYAEYSGSDGHDPDTYAEITNDEYFASDSFLEYFDITEE
ncbi:CRISPR-associated protein Csx16 [Robertmurraya sp. DFI.2.37]|uniref:CRISPR-associated protein Csx16 n=1 Tax=Robertmurraya sp. DFI.2.37 TaxID=3031819 RepID=UPI001247C9D4|nr:CRISPR-associated protein Csx16 [Robertmurraya sp. DFI.2.37]MDF1510859.1 CRISPR-associated protein Csx16 [Robertmurraya sp. DFI.2.37]